MNIEVVPIVEKKSPIKHCINKGLRAIKADKQLFFFDINKELANVDMFFSIGGDIYTIDGQK